MRYMTKRFDHQQNPCKGCSECDWIFKGTLPVGNTLDEIKTKFAERCKKEFLEHDCQQHKRRP